jgi:hypothetical protein
MASGIEKSGTPSEIMPENIDLSTVEITTLDEMLTDLKTAMQKNQEIGIVIQQAQQTYQNNQSQMNGLMIAIQKLIQIKVRTSGFVGDYTYDNEKKCLVRSKNVTVK